MAKKQIDGTNVIIRTVNRYKQDKGYMTKFIDFTRGYVVTEVARGLNRYFPTKYDVAKLYVR